MNISGQPQQSYSYDRWGNLGSASSSTNRLTAGTYDTRGNLTHLDGQKVASYDGLSRQIRYDGLPERYLYDGAGERSAVVPPAKAKFYTITPCRVFDTREPAFAPALSPNVSRVVAVRGAGGVNSACASPNGVPNDATITAVSGNLTATGSTQAGSLRLMPEGSGSSVMTLNYGANQTRANNFNLGLSTDGKLTITLFGTVTGHGIVDLNGYYKNDGTIGPQAWRLTLRDEGNRLATEYTVTSTAARLKNYFYFGNLLVASRASSGAFLYYHSDQLGTPRLVTNASAQKVEEHKYFPYGQPLSPGLGSQPHKLAAMEQDSASGFFFDHARYLGNGTAAGRFLSPDKVGGSPMSPQSWNRYAYARNNPLRLIDPNGLWVKEAVKYVGSLVKRGQETMSRIKHNLTRPEAVRLQREGEDIVYKSGREAYRAAREIGEGTPEFHKAHKGSVGPKAKEHFLPTDAHGKRVEGAGHGFFNFLIGLIPGVGAAQLVEEGVGASAEAAAAGADELQRMATDQPDPASNIDPDTGEPLPPPPNCQLHPIAPGCDGYKNER